MENKEVERRLNKLHRKVGRPILEFEREFLQLDISRISVGYNQLEKENAELIKQLQEKDKALDEACDYISKIGINDKWQGVSRCENCKCIEKICWDCKSLLKEMFENGTN